MSIIDDLMDRWLNDEADLCCVPDEQRQSFIDAERGTVRAHLKRAEIVAEVYRVPGLLARIDQTRATMREGAMRVIRQHFNEPPGLGFTGPGPKADEAWEGEG